jgi:hypothetical protein
MPANLGDSKLSSVYTSFVHLSSDSLNSNLEYVYDGAGNRTTLQVSTTSVQLSNVTINNITYPTSVGPAQGVVTSDGSSNFTVSSLASILSNINTTIPSDGVYSSPVITVEKNIVSSIVSSLDNKTFFYPSRTSVQIGPSKEQLLSVATWNSPVNGDKLNILQKITKNGAIHDIAINVFTYSTGSGWTGPVTY